MGPSLYQHTVGPPWPHQQVCGHQVLSPFMVFGQPQGQCLRQGEVWLTWSRNETPEGLCQSLSSQSSSDHQDLLPRDSDIFITRYESFALMSLKTSLVPSGEYQILAQTLPPPLLSRPLPPPLQQNPQPPPLPQSRKQRVQDSAVSTRKQGTMLGHALLKLSQA